MFSKLRDVNVHVLADGKSVGVRSSTKIADVSVVEIYATLRPPV